MSCWNTCPICSKDMEECACTELLDLGIYAADYIAHDWFVKVSEPMKGYDIELVVDAITKHLKDIMGDK